MSKARLTRFIVILVVAGVVYWQRGQFPKSGDTGPKRGETAVLKEAPFSGGGKEIPKEQADPVPTDHWRNWLDCVKTRQKPRADVDA